MCEWMLYCDVIFESEKKEIPHLFSTDITIYFQFDTIFFILLFIYIYIIFLNALVQVIKRFFLSRNFGSFFFFQFIHYK